MPEELLIDVSPFESRVALVKDGAVEEVHLARAAGYSSTGNIYLGKVVRVIPGMQAAFVDIGLERPGFLHASDISRALVATANDSDGHKLGIRDLLHDGQELLVQVQRDPMGTKGARLSTNLALASKYLVLMPRGDQVGLSQKITDERERLRLFKLLRPLAESSDMGLIARTLSEGSPASSLNDDFNHLLRQWARVVKTAEGAKAPRQVFQELPIQTRLVRDLVGSETAAIFVNDADIHQRLHDYLNQYAPDYVDRLRLYTDAEPMFELHNIERELLAALEPTVRLNSGGTLVIEQTEALTSIDVNTAGFLGTKNLEETAFITNMEAAASIPRQLRLRNLGGIIVIDFIDMKDAGHQESVLTKLREALARDPAKSQVEGFSFLGLVQLSRKRTRESLTQVMCGGCSHCNGSGYVKTAESTCMEIFRAIAAEHQADVNGPRAATADKNGAYILTSNAAVVDRLLDEEASVYQSLVAKLGHDVRLAVDSAYRYDQFDLVFVPGRSI